jgi:hypothetical protein
MGIAKVGVINAAEVERAFGEISAVSHTLTLVRQDAQGLMEQVLERRLDRAAAERRLVSMGGDLTACTRRITDLTPTLGTTTAARVFRAVAESRAVDVAEYLDLAGRVVRRWLTADTSVVIADAPGVNLKPDPLLARTPEEFNAALQEYHSWAGAPSFGAMSDRCGGSPVKSTFRSALLKSGTLPKLPMVTAIVTGCGGSEEDKQVFASAWRAVKAGRAVGERGRHDEQPRHLRPVDGTRERLA